MRPTRRSQLGTDSGIAAAALRRSGGGMTLPLLDLPAPALGEDERYTTRDTIAWCKQMAGVAMFDLDVAACEESHHADVFYTVESDGLSQPWFGRCWCNPPYSNIAPWVDRAWAAIHSPHGGANRADVVAMLIPGNRTEQKWWQFHIEPHRDRGGLLRSHFLPGRTAFARPGSGGVGQSGAPFGCVLLVWRRQ